MAKPMLQVEQHVERLEEAILKMAARLMDNPQGSFGLKDYEEIKEIIYGGTYGAETTSEISPKPAA
jgi:hypothetical protein